jgi:transcriptional regulator with XRE-family HTH domain
MGDRILLRGDLIDKLRLYQGLTRTELARKCGFSQQTRTRISKGGPVSMRTARRLAQALGVQMSKIIRGSR